jgi:hypothetical protein
MSQEPEYPPDIAILQVTAPPVVQCGSTFTIDVTVFAPDEDFEDGVAYRLFLHVCPCEGEPPKYTPKIQTGHVQDAPWTTATSTIPFTVTAGATPDIYEVKAVLLEGPKGVPEPDDPPSIVSAGPIVVIP